MRFRLLAASSVLVASLFVDHAARAQPDYPLEIKDHLSLSYAPPCSLCHAKGNTGSATVITPFGWSMRARGLVVENDGSVDKALDDLKSRHTDSDGDGVGDIDELVAGTDPNTAGPVKIPNGKEPGYGCGGSAPDPNNPSDSILFPLPVALGLLAKLRRRGTRKAEQSSP